MGSMHGASVARDHSTEGFSKNSGEKVVALAHFKFAGGKKMRLPVNRRNGGGREHISIHAEGTTMRRSAGRPFLRTLLAHCEHTMT